MAKQLIFPQVTVDELEMSLAAPGGDAPYLQSCAFAMERKTLESSTIDAPVQLAERVNPGSDTDTAIAIFEAYPNLNPLEASSRGFWTHLTHVELWDYMRERFKSVLETSDEVSRKKKIRGKWFLSDISQGGLMRHPLAGLWWGVKLSVVPERGEGRYDLSRILLRDLDFLTRTFGTYQLGRLPNAAKGILEYIFEHQEDFKSSFEPKIRHIMKHFNSIGGVLQLGCLPASFYGEELDRTKTEWIEAKRSRPDDGNDEENEGASSGATGADEHPVSEVE